MLADRGVARVRIVLALRREEDLGEQAIHIDRGRIGHWAILTGCCGLRHNAFGVLAQTGVVLVSLVRDGGGGRYSLISTA